MLPSSTFGGGAFAAAVAMLLVALAPAAAAQDGNSGPAPGGGTHPGEAAPGESGAEVVFIDAGKPVLVHEDGEPWERGEGYLEGTGKRNLLFAKRAFGEGDFHIKAQLSIERLDSTGAKFVLGQSAVGLDGRYRKLNLKGGHFGRRELAVAPARDHITPRKPFLLEAVRRGKTLVLSIDGKEFHRGDFPDDHLGTVFITPGKAKVRVYQLAATGSLDSVSSPEAFKVFVDEL